MERPAYSSAVPGGKPHSGGASASGAAGDIDGDELSVRADEADG
ncbi:MAG TPA: hypothetical protein VFH79_00135 [Candidatus Limnocylindria bacterium]|nr:hypothetical protein [Candidatus Limnocylindria bacterium]